MSEEEEYEVQYPFFERYASHLKQLGVIALILGFFAAYRFLGPVKTVLDLAITPAVAGITIVYGKVSTVIYNLTNVNLGFVTKKRDPEFDFQVRLANHINNREAGPIIDIAAQQLNPLEQRETALKGLLKFDSSSDWVQPFLNELVKGGLPGLYEQEAPILTELMKQIRSEGGIRNSLVRAYAEVVFAFMLQVPDQTVLRIRAISWVSDVLAEDALFLIVPRIEREADPLVRVAILKALWDIQAISDRSRALKELKPIYIKPPWPEVKLPVAVILARLGYDRAYSYLGKKKFENLNEEQKIAVRLARTKKRFPKELRITKFREVLLAKRERARDLQYNLAVRKKQKIDRQEKVKEMMLAQASSPETSRTVVKEQASKPVSQPKKTRTEKKVSPSVATAPKAPPAKKAEKFSGFHKDLTSQQTKTAVKAGKDVQVKDEKLLALIKEEDIPLPPPPPREKVYKKAKTEIGYVDFLFKVKADEATLYESPGVNQMPTGKVLKKGNKGTATFKIVLGTEEWYQVRSKKKTGWVLGSGIKIFDLSPTGKSKAPSQAKKGGTRKEYTFFEANIENVPLFEKPFNNAKEVAYINPGVAYLATRSKKAGGDRWFYLEIESDKKGWARGTDLQLSDIRKPVKMVVPMRRGTLDASKSAFAAKWVVATVKGVGVYKRASIAGKMIAQISPPDIYPVLEVKEGGGKEWYKIKISKKKSGWVQTLDVNLTKPKE